MVRILLLKNTAKLKNIRLFKNSLLAMLTTLNRLKSIGADQKDVKSGKTGGTNNVCIKSETRLMVLTDMNVQCGLKIATKKS